MKPRIFNSIMPKVNEIWAAGILNMEINPERGPDLIDETKAVEVKFKLIHPGKYTHICWRTLGHQIEEENEHKRIYWALGTYMIDRPVSEVRTKDRKKLEAMTEERTMHIVQWDWIKQFQAYHHQGKTDLSEWNHYILFPKARLLPEVIHEQPVKKGRLYFTRGVNLEDFQG